MLKKKKKKGVETTSLLSGSAYDVATFMPLVSMSKLNSYEGYVCILQE